MTYEDKLKYHTLDKNGKPTGVFDERIVQHILDTQSMFIYAGQPFVYTNGYYKMDMGGTRIQSMIADHIIDTFIKSSTISRIYKRFYQKAELAKEYDELNHFPDHWVNFRNGMYDPIKGELHPHDPKYFCLNQIPHKYDPAAEHGPGNYIDKYLHFITSEDDDRQMLLQYIGLCCTHDISQQKMLILNGLGGTGKSTLINLIQEVVGIQNISNVALTQFENDRFASIDLMGKLMNACADLEIDALDNTSVVKKLVGDDRVRGQFKGENAVNFMNYAKLLFSTNELPLVRNEKTNGFYRRLLILTMNNKPAAVDPKLQSKLKSQVPYLIDLAMKALHDMYDGDGLILNSQASLKAVAQLNKDSDTVEAFVQECCEKCGDNVRTSRIDLYDAYSDFCKDDDRQTHTRNNFYKALRNKGFSERRTTAARYFIGIRLRKAADPHPAEGFGPRDDQQEIPFDA